MVATRFVGMAANMVVSVAVGTEVVIAHLLLETVALLTRHFYLLRLAHL